MLPNRTSGDELLKLALAGTTDSGLSCLLFDFANLVLACGPCNDERRDQPWEEFLRNRCLTRREYDVRRRRILEWVRQYGGKELQTSQSLHEYAQLYIDSALGAVDAVVYVLRDIRDGVD